MRSEIYRFAWKDTPYPSKSLTLPYTSGTTSPEFISSKRGAGHSVSIASNTFAGSSASIQLIPGTDSGKLLLSYPENTGNVPKTGSIRLVQDESGKELILNITQQSVETLPLHLINLASTSWDGNILTFTVGPAATCNLAAEDLAGGRLGLILYTTNPAPSEASKLSDGWRLLSSTVTGNTYEVSLEDIYLPTSEILHVKLFGNSSTGQYEVDTVSVMDVYR